MLTTLALATSIYGYGFPIGVRMSYDLKVEMEGFLPVLGGREGKAEINISFDVQRVENSPDGANRVWHDFTSFSLLLNGARMPFTLDNVRSFFPKVTTTFAPNGKVLATDAPKKALPASIPALDVQRFPEISFLPVEFSADRSATNWRFERVLSGAPMKFEVQNGEDPRQLSFKAAQTTTTFESDSNQPVASASNAAYKLVSTVDGTGTVRFEKSRDIVSELVLDAKTQTDVRGIVNDYASQRVLRTKVTLKLKP